MGDAGGDEQPQSLAQRGKDKVVGKATERLEGMEGGGQISEALSSSSTIHLIMLLQLIPSVYLSWYIVAFVLCLVFGLRGDFFILTFFEPFDHENFSPAVEAGDWRWRPPMWGQSALSGPSGWRSILTVHRSNRPSTRSDARPDVTGAFVSRAMALRIRRSVTRLFA